MIKSILTGNRKVFETGSFILFSQDSTALITIEMEPGFVFSVEIAFETRKDTERELEKSVDGLNNRIKLVCVNFDNSFGTGTTQALELARFHGKEVSMHLWSSLLGHKENGATRKVEYTIFVEE